LRSNAAGHNRYDWPDCQCRDTRCDPAYGTRRQLPLGHGASCANWAESRRHRQQFEERGVLLVAELPDSAQW